MIFCSFASRSRNQPEDTVGLGDKLGDLLDKMGLDEMSTYHFIVPWMKAIVSFPDHFWE